MRTGNKFELGESVTNENSVKEISSRLSSDPELLQALLVKLRSDPQLIREVESRVELSGTIRSLRDIAWILAFFALSTFVLFFLMNAQISGPISTLGRVPPGIDGAGQRALAIQDLLRGASWAAVIAAVGVAAGTFVGLASGIIGAVGRGITAGASAAVCWAAILIAQATSAG